MTLRLAWWLLRRRPAFLTERLDVHEGIHQTCPGWCPCAVDTDPGEGDLAWVAAAA